jgi:outer membrane immunogenic protein
MNWKLFSMLLVASAFACQSAAAADLYRPASLKDETAAPPAAIWSGLYVGGHVGLATGNTTGSVPGIPPPFNAITNTDYDMNGAMWGGHVGYNFQFNRYVLGVEGTFDGTSLEGDTSCVIFLSCHREADWIGTIVARAGFLATPNTLIYGMGGIAWGKLNTDVKIGGFNILSGDDVHTGWTAGVGIEQAFNDRISARIEYAHVDLGDETTGLHVAGGLGGGFFGGSIPDRTDAEFDMIRLGVGYKLPK